MILIFEKTNHKTARIERKKTKYNHPATQIAGVNLDNIDLHQDEFQFT